MEAAGLTKRFGSIVACDSVSVSVRPGEIHALLGENGAGKSTLVKLLYGALEPDAGTILWRGEPLFLESPAQAITLGIGMVSQHFSLFEALTVAENILLGLPERHSLRGLARTIREISREYGLALDPEAGVHDLSVGQRQRVEIVRCLLQQPCLIIMDEPTSVLTPQETDVLFSTLRRLAGEGRGILFITHRLQEVIDLADRATILRRGKVVAEVEPRTESPESLASLMVGAEIDEVSRPVEARRSERPRLEIDHLSLPPAGPFSEALNGICLDVHGGEVVCIAGVAGNGQGEFFEALSGERRADGVQTIRIDGTPCGHLGVTGRRQLGAAFVPEERLGHAAVPEFSLCENIVLTRHSTDKRLVRHGLVNENEADTIRQRVVDDFDVRNGKNREARSLSGGNLQKFVVGRELDRGPAVLVINQPTWGVDAGAATLIRQAIVDLAIAGAAVLVISQDLDEIFTLADRIAVMSRGGLSEVLPATKATRETVGLIMGGIGEMPPGQPAASEHAPANSYSHAD